MNCKVLAPTRKDPDCRITNEAIGCLEAARNLRVTRASWVREAYLEYDQKGPLTSGVEQEHWPEELKDRLRTNAREIAKAKDDAFVLWRRAGRRASTLQALLPNYRIDGSRY